MKLKFFAGLMLLLSLAMSYGAATPRHTVAFSSVRRFGGNTGTLTVGNTAGLSTTNFTPGSYISAATVDGSNAVSADISGTWGGGTVSLVFVPINATGASGMTHTVPAAQITQFSTGQPSGITAGATDLFSTTVNGAGTIYAVTPSGLTGSVTVTLRVGPGMSLLSALINSLPLPTGASTSALQTTGNSSLASILSQLQATLAISAASLPLPSGASTSALQNAGKPTPLIAASQLGSISGTYASGVHKIAQIQGENASGTTVYLQIYDATSQPSANTVPIAEVTVSFGISTAPTSNRMVMTPDYIQASSGIWFCFVTAPGAFNSANLVGSGTGLLVRVYGQ